VESWLGGHFVPQSVIQNLQINYVVIGFGTARLPIHGAIMPWTRERLESEWIKAPISELGDRASIATSAFDCVEKHFGPEWLSVRNLQSTGIAPTLNVVLLGECLVAIENIKGFDFLVEKVRANDFSALAEMEAVRMFHLMGGVEIELEPDLVVGISTKKPDFRVRRAGERWTYVEVTRPDTSETVEDARKLLKRLQSVANVKREFSLEIFLRRDPNATDEKALLLAATTLADSDKYETLDLPDLALITKQPFTGPIITPIDHPGEDNSRPRVGTATGIICNDGTEPNRLVSVRMPYSDDRADLFIKREAKQLSKSEQGLIMMDMTKSNAGMKYWKSFLLRRFQPNVHTRVGGVCMFSSGIELGYTGIHLIFDFVTVENIHATNPLPGWIFEELKNIATVENAKRGAPNLAPSA
jgi:hypothetical protein